MNKPFPLITAHSGCIGTRENSMESAIAGFKSGADFIEVDVRGTKDNFAVLSHDAYVKSKSGKDICIYNYTLKEIKDLIDGKEGGGIITLDEVLDIVREFHGRINLDLKGPAAAEAMIQSVHRMKMKDDVVITGCQFEVVHYLKKEYPEYTFYLNADYYNNPTIFSRLNCMDAIAASCCGVNLQYQICSPELVKMAREHSLLVSVWTVNEEEDMHTLIKMGVDSITTKNPDVLYRLKGDRNSDLV